MFCLFLWFLWAVYPRQEQQQSNKTTNNNNNNKNRTTTATARTTTTTTIKTKTRIKQNKKKEANKTTQPDQWTIKKISNKDVLLFFGVVLFWFLLLPKQTKQNSRTTWSTCFPFIHFILPSSFFLVCLLFWYFHHLLLVAFEIYFHDVRSFVFCVFLVGSSSTIKRTCGVAQATQTKQQNHNTTNYQQTTKTTKIKNKQQQEEQPGDLFYLYYPTNSTNRKMTHKKDVLLLFCVLSLVVVAHETHKTTIRQQQEEQPFLPIFAPIFLLIVLQPNDRKTTKLIRAGRVQSGFGVDFSLWKWIHWINHLWFVSLASS